MTSLKTYKEKDFQTEFNKWVKYRTDGTAAFELKLSRTGSLSFDAVVEHQLNALLNARNNKVIHKIPDLGMQNPFDSFVLDNVSAFVVVMYRSNRKEFIMIDVKKWDQERLLSQRKSLTEERAKEIGIVCSFP